MKKAITIISLSFFLTAASTKLVNHVNASSPLTNPRASLAGTAPDPSMAVGRVGQQSSACLIVIPAPPVVVAPGQPAIGSDAAATPNALGVRTAQPTSGIINALCDVTLNIVGCGFPANSATLGCDTNGDGVPDLTFPLSNVTPIDRNLVQATLSIASSGLPGSAFPLACCGGFVTLTLKLHVGPGDDNIFGDFTETATCVIDVGLRAPVVISASPSSGNCATPQDLLVSGGCFILRGGVVNVTSVFAVDRSNPNSVLQAARFAILSPNLIDALFDFGSAGAGKTFLIFASGPRGTSRNLTSLPAGAQAGCPLGNEQGVQVAFTCSAAASGSVTQTAPSVTSCELNRTPSGAPFLTVAGSNIHDGALITIGGRVPRKVKFMDPDVGSNTFKSVQVRGGICALLPGQITITNPNGEASPPFQCGAACQ